MKKLLLLLSLCLPVLVFSQPEVLWLLSGGLQPNSAAFRVKTSTSCDSVRVYISTTNPPSAPYIVSTLGIANSSNDFNAACLANGLTEGTDYYYVAKLNNTIDNSADDIGHFRTPRRGPYSFSFVTGSCNRFPDSKTFQDFRTYNPDFYLSPGDLHYVNPNSSDVNVHRAAYDSSVFNWPDRAEAYRNMGFAYVRDDHDYCGNDANGRALPGAQSTRQAYKEFIPHYPLYADSSIYQSFDYGRVKFILSDLRGERVKGTTAMGLTQKAWFKQQCLNARNNNMMICWVSSYSWYGILSDNWGGDPNERKELADFFLDSSIANIFIVSGDAHMLCVDDGRNGYLNSTGNTKYNYPVLQAAPIQNNGSWKGGTYNQGQFLNILAVNSQYAVVTVDDDGGDSICITFDGYRKDITSGSTTKLLSYSFCRSLVPTNDTLISLTSEPELAQVELFPNPVENKLFVKTSLPQQNLWYGIYNTSGKLVMKGELNKDFISTETLPAADYIFLFGDNTKVLGKSKFTKR